MSFASSLKRDDPLKPFLPFPPSCPSRLTGPFGRDVQSTVRSKTDGRPLKLERAQAGGKSELRRAVRRVTPGQGNLKESGTENIPPEKGGRTPFSGKGEKVR